jgi:MFS family permease
MRPVRPAGADQCLCWSHGRVGRTILPLIAQNDFGLAARAVTLSFLVSFGLAKALSNLFAGRFSERIGRKRILVAGWLAGLGVPVLLILAPNWGWVVFANVLLGINQGLCWSTTVIMKIDLVGSRRRGLAMGFNEASGYLAVSFAAFPDRICRTFARPAPLPVLGLQSWDCCFQRSSCTRRCHLPARAANRNTHQPAFQSNRSTVFPRSSS